MNFGKVIKILTKEMTKEKIDFALVGGFAVSCYIKPRFTQDIDFIILSESAKTVSKILTALGYQRQFKSDNIETYLSKDPVFGRIDLQLAFRKYTVAMLERANKIEILPKLFIKVLQPEDIIGLKVQAINNDPNRYFQDMSDIENLMKLKQCKDLARVKEYFEIFNKQDEYDNLIKRTQKE